MYMSVKLSPQEIDDGAEISISCETDQGNHDFVRLGGGGGSYTFSGHVEVTPEKAIKITRRARQLTHEEIVQLLMDEYKYWRDSSEGSFEQDLAGVGAVGALANVIAAIKMGHKRVDHPESPQQQSVAGN